MNEQKNDFITFLGDPLTYNHLRSWIECPYTLTDEETKAFRKFIESHGIDIDKTPFGWFFEVYYKRHLQLSQSEIDRVLKVVDEMEDIAHKFTCNDYLHIENHLRYMTKQLMDYDDDGPEFFEVFRDQRTGQTRLNIDYYPEKENEWDNPITKTMQETCDKCESKNKPDCRNTCRYASRFKLDQRRR